MTQTRYIFNAIKKGHKYVVQCLYHALFISGSIQTGANQVQPSLLVRLMGWVRQSRENGNQLNLPKKVSIHMFIHLTKLS